MVDPLGFGLGLGLLGLITLFHYTQGASRQTPEDIAQDVLERRAETVPETDFPEPGNRAMGGGGGGAAVAAGAETEGELEDSEATEEAGFDPSAIAEEDVEYHDIEFAKEGETIEVANNETLLEAGEDEGWDLPYACREGQCLSCAGRIADGDAHEYMRMSNNEVLSDAELEKGYVLTCVAYPTAEFTVETNESP
ncbi:MAG: 2Fe-2S iron-sulfur cluster-binding protein [Halobacteriaceae archaeon]